MTSPPAHPNGGILHDRLNRLRKNRQECHPEEPQATKDLRICLILQMQRFFASLRMTAPTSFSAACEGGKVWASARRGGGRTPNLNHRPVRKSWNHFVITFSSVTKKSLKESRVAPPA